MTDRPYSLAAIPTKFGLWIAIVMATTGAAFWHGANVKAASATSSTPTVSMRGQPVRPPPVQLQTSLELVGRSVDGKVGIAVRDVADTWSAGYDAGRRFPQQSVSKLWVAVALLEAVDRGAVRLDEAVIVRPEDLTLFNQPIRRLVGEEGYKTTLGALLTRAIAESDNTANDVLLRRIGGPVAVKAVLTRKGLGGIAFGPGERIQQTATAGLVWNSEFSDAMAFRRARAALPMEARKQALDAYLTAPPDGASPYGIARALAALHNGTLLSQTSSTLLLETMAASHTGHRRLRAGLGKGWQLAHKTGTGQELGNLATGFNDVGLVTARSGRVYAVAVMISHSRAPIEARQALIANVARAIVAYEEPQTTLKPVIRVASTGDAVSMRDSMR